MTHRLIDNAYARFKAACLDEGMRDGQFKFNQLMQDESRRRKFQVLIVGDILSEAEKYAMVRRADRVDRQRERLQRMEERRLARLQRRAQHKHAK